MVKGLDRFRNHFREYTDQFVLIGGTACDLVMSEAGAAFRATKDLDIVLLIESLTPDFGRIFWEFIRNGGYQARERETGGTQYYRFSKPQKPDYPGLLELFSRAPDSLDLPDGSILTSIPIGEDVSRMSAILLDDTYYEFLKSGRRVIHGIPIVGTEFLMALKAKAWLELSDRRERGESVDSGDILKHKRDIFRLVQIVDPEISVSTPEIILKDLERFLSFMVTEGVDLQTLGIRESSLGEAIDSIRAQYRRQ